MRQFSPSDRMRVAIGEHFEIVLDEPFTSGYAYEAQCSGPIEVVCWQRTPRLIEGASTITSFEIAATGHGEATIVFILKARFDPIPAEELVCKIEVA